MKLFLILLFLSFPLIAAENVVLTSTNNVSITEEIDELSTANAAQELISSCQNKFEDKYLILNTPGGSVTAGRNFIDVVKGLPCRVNTITIFAASMGYQIVQNLDTRYILPSGVLMSHRARLSGIGGQLPGELISELNFYQEFINELDVIAAKRVGIPLEQYKKDIYDELWLIGKKAQERKHADKVVVPKCNKSLEGTREKKVQTLFGEFSLVFSQCPLILGPIEIKRATPEQKAKIMEMYKFQNKKEVWLK